MMRAGLLNGVIVIRRPVIAKDGYGSERVAYEDCMRVRAHVMYSWGNRVTESHEILHSCRVIFTVRCQYDVNEKMRIAYNGTEYMILSVNRDRAGQRIVVTAESVNV